MRSLWTRIQTSWRPKPIDRPQVDPQLQHLDPITRGAESIRYSILSLEYWVSKGGELREWVRHNVRAFAWLLIPELLIAPVVGLILAQVLKWTTILSILTHHLVLLSFLGFVVLVVLALVVTIIKAMLR